MIDKNPQPVETTLRIVLGTLVLAGLIWTYFYADIPEHDPRRYIYGHLRFLLFLAGLVSSLLPGLLLKGRLSPIPAAWQIRINNRILRGFNICWRILRIRGTIVLCMLLGFLLSELLHVRPTGGGTRSLAQFLQFSLLNAGLVLWFGANVSLYLRRIVREERLQEAGAQHSREIWAPYLCGPGVCRVYVVPHGRFLGQGTNSVIVLLKRQAEVLQYYSTSIHHEKEVTRSVDAFEIAERQSEDDVLGYLRPSCPTIVVGGPKSNPLTRVFLKQLRHEYEPRDSKGFPVWRIDSLSSELGNFVKPASANRLAGVYLEEAGFMLPASQDSSCGIVYFLSLNKQPLCVLAGYTSWATLETARHAMQQLEQRLQKELEIAQAAGGVVEVWIRCRKKRPASCESVRLYDRMDKRQKKAKRS